MAKKNSKGSKAARRKKEILKAHAKSSIRGQFSDIVAGAIKDEDLTQPKKVTQRLHLKAIRADLIKTVIFALLVVVFLFVLKSQNLEFDFGINK